MEGDRSLSIGGICLLRAGGWRGLVSQEGDLFDVDFGGGGYCRELESCKSSSENADGALSTGQAGT